MLEGIVGVVTKSPTADDAAAPVELSLIDVVRDVRTTAVTRVDPAPALSQWPPTLLQLRCAMNL